MQINDPLVLYLYSLEEDVLLKKLTFHGTAPIIFGRENGYRTSTTPEESNGYFVSKVMSRRHAKMWAENRRVCSDQTSPMRPVADDWSS